MNLMTKLTLALAAAAVPAVAFIVHADEWVGRQIGRHETEMAATSTVRPKDESRVAATMKDDKASLLIQLAHASRQPNDVRMAQMMPPPPFGPPPSFGAPPHPHGWWHGHAPPDAMGPPPPPHAPLTRAACEDRIDRKVAFAAFMKSKLRLQPQQRAVWQKLEQAAEPALGRLQAACDRLPAGAGAPPPLPDMIDAMAEQMSARAALLKAISGPLRELFNTLSPEQRARLRPPGPPMPPL